MARVMAQFRVLVDPGVDPEEVAGKIQESLEPLGVQLMDRRQAELAFGIVALTILLSTPEEEGITDKVEEALSSIPGVSSVELETMSRGG